jgi:hypothetical protein
VNIIQLNKATIVINKEKSLELITNGI